MEESLRELKLPELIEKYKTRPLAHHVKLEHFLHGQPVEAKREAIDELLKSDSVLRITHVESIEPVIKEFCQKLCDQSGLLVNCMLVIHPSRTAQAQGYHADPQHQVVYLLSGHKIWSFPIMEKESSIQLAINGSRVELINLGLVPFTTDEFKLSPGELFFIPYAYIRRDVQVSEEISAHLVFAANEITVGDLGNFLGKSVLGLDQPERRYHQLIDEQLELPPLNLENVTGKIDEFFLTTMLSKYRANF